MNRQDGSILILSLIFMLALITLVGALSISLNSELRIVNNEQNMVQAQYYAESVIEYASFYLNNVEDSTTDSFWTKSGEVSSEKRGEIKNKLKAPDLEISSLIRQKDGESYIITTNVRYRGVRDRLMVTYDPAFKWLGIFDFAMVAGGDLNVNGPIKVKGPLGARDRINNKHNADSDSDFFENLDIEDQLALLEEFLEAAVDNPGTTRIPSHESYVIEYEDRLVLDIDGKIIYITGNLTIDKHLYIMGSGILIIEGSLNQNGDSLLFANYDPHSGTYTDDYAILYFRTGNPNPTTGNFKGMLMGRNDVNLITKTAEGFQLIGSTFSGGNLNANENTSIIHDAGYVNVLKELAEKYKIPILMGFQISDWMEF